MFWRFEEFLYLNLAFRSDYRGYQIAKLHAKKILLIVFWVFSMFVCRYSMAKEGRQPWKGLWKRLVEGSIVGRLVNQRHPSRNTEMHPNTS